MNTPSPKISVVIPLYNQSDTIQRTVNSVLGQGFADFEIIVVDDGSTDDVGDTVSAMDDPRVRLITQENQGVSAARNRGTKEARASIIAFLDADDEWYPDFLETILNLEERYPECSVFATSYLIKDVNGTEQVPLMQNFPSTDSDFVFTNYFEAASVSTPPIAACAVAVKKTALDRIGGFPLDIASGEDLLTWARLYAAFDIAYSPLLKGVYWKDSLSWKHNRRSPESNDVVGQELHKILTGSDINGSKKSGLRRYISLWKKIRASQWIASGNRMQALKAITQSLWYYPWNVKVWMYIPFVLLPAALGNKLTKAVENKVDQGRARI